jgi:hypothetical protein
VLRGSGQSSIAAPSETPPKWLVNNVDHPARNPAAQPSHLDIGSDFDWGRMQHPDPTAAMHVPGQERGRDGLEVIRPVADDC